MREDPAGYDPVAGDLKGRCRSIRLYARGPNGSIVGVRIWSTLEVLPLGPFAYRANALLLS